MHEILKPLFEKKTSLLKSFTLILLTILTLAICSIAVSIALMIGMPEKSFQGQPTPLNGKELVIRENLMENLDLLTVSIGERNCQKYEQLEAAAQFIESSFETYGYQPRSQFYEIEGRRYRNIEATIIGTTKPDEIIVVGAHYDTMPDCPGADDNGTGVVSTLALAKLLKDKRLDRTVRFVAFTNEEYPFFWSDDMGSRVYAKQCRKDGDNIIGMIAIETIGFFSNEPGSQNYPINSFGFFPDKGNFLFFVGNLYSRDFLTDSIGAFRKHSQVPSQGIAAFDCFEDISRSDNNSFWLEGYPGFMITDTANFRNPNYHRSSDTMDTLDIDNFTRSVSAFEKMITELATTKTKAK